MADRARTYTTEGVVLRRRNLGEADSIFTVFSLHEGKFDAVARGVRKAKSRMRGHLEPLTRSTMHLARGRTLDVFTQVETISAHGHMRDDLDALTSAIYCCELVDRFTVDRAEQRAVYELLLDLLGALDAGEPLHAVRYFELHLLAITGYEMRLDVCAVCGGKLEAEDALLSGSTGGLVCPGCRGPSTTGRIVSVRAIKALRYAKAASIGEFAALRVDDHLAHEMEMATAEVIRTVLDRELNSRRYLSMGASADGT